MSRDLTVNVREARREDVPLILSFIRKKAAWLSERFSRKHKDAAGPKPCLDGNIPSEVVDQFIVKMDEIDPAAI